LQAPVRKSLFYTNNARKFHLGEYNKILAKTG
jgi:hypothetical protein